MIGNLNFLTVYIYICVYRYIHLYLYIQTPGLMIYYSQALDKFVLLESTGKMRENI